MKAYTYKYLLDFFNNGHAPTVSHQIVEPIRPLKTAPEDLSAYSQIVEDYLIEKSKTAIPAASIFITESLLELEAFKKFRAEHSEQMKDLQQKKLIQRGIGMVYKKAQAYFSPDIPDIIINDGSDNDNDKIMTSPSTPSP